MTVPMGLLMVAGLALAADGDKDANKKEIDKFQGTWKIESLVVDGKKLPEDAFKGVQLVIKGDQFTHSEGGTVTHGHFKVNVATKPKTMDITFTDGPEKGNSIGAIYELEGDTYTVCLPIKKGAERPKEFAAKEGSGHALEVLKRQKP